jgi:hypothetical protein
MRKRIADHRDLIAFGRRGQSSEFREILQGIRKTPPIRPRSATLLPLAVR